MWFLALPTNIRQGWKGKSRPNELAYFASLSIKTKKGFIGMTPGPNVIKPFTAVIYEFS